MFWGKQTDRHIYFIIGNLSSIVRHCQSKRCSQAVDKIKTESLLLVIKWQEWNILNRIICHTNLCYLWPGLRIRPAVVLSDHPLSNRNRSRGRRDATFPQVNTVQVESRIKIKRRIQDQTTDDGADGVKMHPLAHKQTTAGNQTRNIWHIFYGQQTPECYFIDVSGNLMGLVINVNQIRFHKKSTC